MCFFWTYTLAFLSHLIFFFPDMGYLCLLSLFSFSFILLEICHFFFLIFRLFRAAPLAYVGSQAKGLIRAVAAGLR